MFEEKTMFAGWSLDQWISGSVMQAHEMATHIKECHAEIERLQNEVIDIRSVAVARKNEIGNFVRYNEELQGVLCQKNDVIKDLSSQLIEARESLFGEWEPVTNEVFSKMAPGVYSFEFRDGYTCLVAWNPNSRQGFRHFAIHTPSEKYDLRQAIRFRSVRLPDPQPQPKPFTICGVEFSEAALQSMDDESKRAFIEAAVRLQGFRY